MSWFKALNLPEGKAICYSGFRAGQRPGHKYPSYDEVLQDLQLLKDYWTYLRLYDCDEHAKMVLEIIHHENLPFKVMLGAYIEAEQNNFNCPWGGGVYDPVQLNHNAIENQRKIDKLIAWGNQYEDIVFALSVGNEACVSWTDHLVPEHKIVRYVKQVKNATNLAVTYCENYVPWAHTFTELAQVVDFISIHIYPLWENKDIHQALAYSKENYWAVKAKNPNKPIMITEAGWATKSNGHAINPHFANEELQHQYFTQLTNWVDEEGIPTFFFEAFDESWKGSSHELEPEKHWGLFFENRTPKEVVKRLMQA